MPPLVWTKRNSRVQLLETLEEIQRDGGPGYRLLTSIGVVRTSLGTRTKPWLGGLDVQAALDLAGA
jgi:hypothetical protein